MAADYIIADGKITLPGQVEAGQTLLSGYFSLAEGIWFCNGSLPLFGEHMDLLNKKISFFRLPFPSFLKDSDELLRLAKRLINKNKAYFSGIIELKFFWGENGEHYFIRCLPNKENHFRFQPEGILMSFADDVKFSGSRLAQFGFADESLWQYGGKDENRNSGLIFLNHKGEVCETRGANLFFIKEGTLITPSPETGCYLDTLRVKVLEATVACGFQVLETTKITPELALTMDEAFLASETSGICKITGIGQKRFVHAQTQLIYLRLNQMLTEVS